MLNEVRMSTQLGLRDLVMYQCENYGKQSSIPPRLLPLPNSVLDQEERIRAYWAVELLDSSSTIGAAWNTHLSRPEATSSMPGHDHIWNVSGNSNMGMSALAHFETPSAFSLYVNLVAIELLQLHYLLQKPFDVSVAKDLESWNGECDKFDRNLQKWRDVAISILGPLTSYNLASNGTFDPNVVLINATLEA